MNRQYPQASLHVSPGGNEEQRQGESGLLNSWIHDDDDSAHHHQQISSPSMTGEVTQHQMGLADAVRKSDKRQSVTTTTIKAKKHVQEQPKKVSSKRPWPAISEFLIFQLPSVAVTLALLALYIRNFTWNPDPSQLSALLFAARVHEGLIVASLSQILYHHTRRALLGPRGITRPFTC
ncbi:hypothetical protein QBC37DRAFT_375193 [Rhypophila decipiens]|uniref:Uncharacterized protein n=1 Tax=Rhypophila decipiens TaxID=261697 RepID=A0AAN6Y4D5_9PEZI|nr:hypothetical protein QBC37DRAFT_375193 [Rhypophila decipiens]